MDRISRCARELVGNLVHWNTGAAEKAEEIESDLRMIKADAIESGLSDLEAEEKALAFVGNIRHARWRIRCSLLFRLRLSYGWATLCILGLLLAAASITGITHSSGSNGNEAVDTLIFRPVMLYFIGLLLFLTGVIMQLFPDKGRRLMLIIMPPAVFAVTATAGGSISLQLLVPIESIILFMVIKNIMSMLFIAGIVFYLVMLSLSSQTVQSVNKY